MNMPEFDKTISGKAVFISKNMVDYVEYSAGKRKLVLKNGKVYNDSWLREEIMSLGYEY